MALQPLGITCPQLILLAYLSANEGMYARILCDELGIEKSTMSRNLKRLLALRLIEMGPLKGKRGRELALTKSGGDMVELAFPVWESTQKKLLELMSRKEREALTLLA